MEQLGRYYLSHEVSVDDVAHSHRAYEVTGGGVIRAMTLRRMLPAFVHQPDLTNILIEGGRIAALLEHSNLVQVLDLDQIEGQWILVTDRVQGQDLGTVIKKAKLRGVTIDTLTALYITNEILQGLAYAHERTDADGNILGIVHRDVCPANVLVGYGGEVKLTGFDYAKMRGRSTPPQPGHQRPRYGHMSPEQALGSDVDHRSDLFSAGLILYELLSGTMAYEARSELEALARAQRGHVRSLSETAPHTTSDLREVVEHALVFDRKQRHPSARVFRDEIARILYSSDPSYARHRIASLMAQVLGDEATEDRNKEKEDRAALEGIARLTPAAARPILPVAQGMPLRSPLQPAPGSGTPFPTLAMSPPAANPHYVPSILPAPGPVPHEPERDVAPAASASEHRTASLGSTPAEKRALAPSPVAVARKAPPPSAAPPAEKRAERQPPPPPPEPKAPAHPPVEKRGPPPPPPSSATFGPTSPPPPPSPRPAGGALLEGRAVLGRAEGGGARRRFSPAKVAGGMTLLLAIGLLGFALSSEQNMRFFKRKLRAAFIGRHPGGVLTIESIPPGARVTLDDEETGKTTPLTVENLESQVVHDLRLELGNEAPVTSTVAIKAGQKQTITLSFPDAVVPLSVKTDPAAAELFVDSRPIGFTPLSLTVQVGRELQLRLNRAGYVEHIRAIVPERRKPIEIDVKLEKSEALLAAEAAEAEALEAEREAEATKRAATKGSKGPKR